MPFPDWLQDIREQDWQPVTGAGLMAFSIAALLVLYLANTGERWIPLLDSANLAFHEAGHPFFGILSERLAVYGGTLGQLFFPLVATASFWKRRETLSFALASLWLFENMFNIARYMADARAQALPLVGGGEHDWTDIFSRWGALGLDTTVAGMVRFFVWLGILALWAWLAWRWRQQGSPDEMQ